MTDAGAYRIRAINDASTSENRIHSDAIARRYGFTGALVSGVSVFGYLTHPLVREAGLDWFKGTVAEVRFLQPAYEQDMLEITAADGAADGRPGLQALEARNENRDLLARLESWRPTPMPPADPPVGAWPRPEPATERQQISWERVATGLAWPDYRFQLSREQHQECLAVIRDPLALYREGGCPPLHPYFLLKECNRALMRRFILPAWIHAGSRLVLREPLRVTDPVTVRTVPLEKWERRGHQFIKLLVVMLREDRVALEVHHTAIFRIGR